jgi:hypothetical protein
VDETAFVEFVPLKRDFYKGAILPNGQKRMELEKMILEVEKKRLAMTQINDKRAQI